MDLCDFILLLMYGDDKYMFCAVRVNDLFMVNSGWRELDWMIYTVLTKLMHRQGSIQHPTLLLSTHDHHVNS